MIDVNSNLKKAVMIVSSGLFFMYFFIQMMMFNSLTIYIKQDLGLENSDIAYISSALYLGNFLFLFISGTLLDRYAVKPQLVFAMLICSITTILFAFSNSFYTMYFLRLVIGLTGAYAFLGPFKVMTQTISIRYIGFAIGFLGLLAMLGGVLAQTPFILLINAVGWRTAVVMNGLLGLVITLLNILVLKKDAKQISVVQQSITLSLLAPFKQLFAATNIRNLLCASYAALMNLSLGIFGALWGSVYLVQSRDVQLEKASLISSLIFIGHIVGAPLLGWFSDRVYDRRYLMVFGACISLFTILGFITLQAQPNVNLYLIAVMYFILGFFAGSQPLAYAILVESNKKELLATAASLISILTMASVTFMQPAFTALIRSGRSVSDVSQVNFTGGLYLIAFCFFIAAILPLVIRYRKVR